MRYKCIGSPDCMKTFEFGHALRAHIASCEAAQKILKRDSDIKKLEYHIGIDYSGIFGIKGNRYYPSFTSLDQTLKFNFLDRFKFSPLEATMTTTTTTASTTRYKPTDSALSHGSNRSLNRRLMKPSASHLMGSAQVKQLLEYQLEQP